MTTASPHSSYPPPRSPSPPTQVFHPSHILPTSVPTPAIIGSAASGAHYSGAKVSHRNSDLVRASFSNGDESVELDESRKVIMDGLKELYECRPTMDILERDWSKDAVFEDPLVYCKGLREVAPQWFSMPKMFSEARTLTTRVLTSTSHRMVFTQTHEYTFKFTGLKKTVKSLVVVDFNDEGKIIHLQDQLNGQDLPNSWGSRTLRRLSAKATPWLVRMPKDKDTKDSIG